LSTLYFDWAGPRESALLEQWDRFVTQSPRGHYCALSTWLRSFEAYGLKPLIALARREKGGPVIGGMGCLTFGAMGFVGVTAPIGPLTDTGSDDAANLILQHAIEHARGLGAFLFQTQFAATEEVPLPFLLPPQNTSAMLPGRPFKATAAPDQMLWIDFSRISADDSPESSVWEQRMLGSFNTNTRRNIRKAEKAGLIIAEAVAEAEVREGFELIEANGREQGYATRTWAEFGSTLLAQIRSDQASLLVAKYEGRPAGAHYSVRAGRRCSYIMGGTVRLEEDPGIGHALHWSAISRARHRGLLGYDLTTSGTPGVLRFKMGFHPEVVKLQEPQYCVLNPLRFRLFERMYPLAKKHKRTVANIVRRIGFGN
jgi:hypothetical protein